MLNNSNMVSSSEAPGQDGASLCVCWGEGGQLIMVKGRANKKGWLLFKSNFHTSLSTGRKKPRFKQQTSDCCGREELHFEETGSQADPGRGLQHEHVFRPLTLTWPETPWTYREPQRWVLLGCGLFQGPKYLPQAVLGHSLFAANISVFLNFQLESYVLVRKQLRIALWKLASAI